MTKSAKNIPGKRPFSQDFSGNSKTDTSFTPSCNVNNIVKQYDREKITLGSPEDPYFHRVQHGDQGQASELSYASAMRAKAEIDSAFALLPSPVRAQYDNDSTAWFEHTIEPKPLTEALNASTDSPVDPAPQAPKPGNSESEAE